jgi:hypothetical protein
MILAGVRETALWNGYEDEADLLVIAVFIAKEQARLTTNPD